MRVDFYQLSRDPAEAAVAAIARNTLKAGERLLVVSDDAEQHARIGQALWQREGFLANGAAGGAHEARQPILLSDTPEPANGARFLAIADGRWRDAPADITRMFYIFGDATLEEARGCWRALGQREDVERRFWKQDGGKWVEGP